MWLVPLLLWVNFFLTSRVCPGEPFPFTIVMIQYVQLVTELFMVYGYITWYQKELKRYSGGETETEEKPKN